jgi:hypothetical protein
MNKQTIFNIYNKMIKIKYSKKKSNIKNNISTQVNKNIYNFIKFILLINYLQVKY